MNSFSSPSRLLPWTRTRMMESIPWRLILTTICRHHSMSVLTRQYTVCYLKRFLTLCTNSCSLLFDLVCCCQRQPQTLMCRCVTAGSVCCRMYQTTASSLRILTPKTTMKYPLKEQKRRLSSYWRRSWLTANWRLDSS